MLYRSQLVSAPARPSDVHLLPDARARERLQVQPLSVAQPAHRAVTPAGADRATDQDLVPEPPDEGEARGADDPRDQRGRPDAQRPRRRPAAVAAASARPLNRPARFVGWIVRDSELQWHKIAMGCAGCAMHKGPAVRGPLWGAYSQGCSPKKKWGTPKEVIYSMLEAA